MDFTSKPFPSGLATRANYRHAFRWLLHNWRNSYVIVENIAGRDILTPYLEANGGKLRKDEVVFSRLKLPGDYGAARRLYNKMKTDTWTATTENPDVNINPNARIRFYDSWDAYEAAHPNTESEENGGNP